MRVSIDLPAGVVATPTKAKNTAHWRETNLIRWDEGVMVPFDGWEESTLSLVDTSETLRAVHIWSDNSNRKWTAYLSETKVYVEFAEALYDISPTVPLVPPDYSGAGGFGDGPYGDDDYGTPRASGPIRNTVGPAFKLDNWGENLIAMSSADGRLLEWVPVIPVAGVCATVANSPTGRTFVITPERHIMVMQANGNPARWDWCDEEDNTEWTISTSTKAGNYTAEPGGPIIASINTPNGNLIWTDKFLTNSRYVGLPFIYSKEPVGTMTTPVTASSVIKTNDGAIWFTETGVFAFNGVNVVAVDCPVWAWVKENINWRAARNSALCVDLANKSEVLFFFPSEADGPNTHYIVFNYGDGWWATGKMGRSAGYSGSFTEYPILTDRNKIYIHGKGSVYPGAVELPWAETFVVNVNQGANMATLNHIIPEVEGNCSGLRFSLIYNTIRTPNNEQSTPQRSIQPSGWVEFMQSGMDFRIKVECVTPSGAVWTVGPIIIDIVGRGLKSK